MKNAVIIILLLIIAGGGWYWYDQNSEKDAIIKEETPAPVPAPDLGNSVDKQNLIKLVSPKPNDVVKSPLLLEGEARGTWYFEASFPVSLYDGNGKLLARAPAEAQSEWMTENFVPFKLGLKFDTPATDTGFLVLEKDNPSGLPEHDDELRIPVRFK